VFWVQADDETTFTQDYKKIAKKLGLAGSVDGSEMLAAVREQIETDPCWLLVLDNADDLKLFGVGRAGRGSGPEHRRRANSIRICPARHPRDGLMGQAVTSESAAASSACGGQSMLAE
jgi:hypothetical protein